VAASGNLNEEPFGFAELGDVLELIATVYGCPKHVGAEAGHHTATLVAAGMRAIRLATAHVALITAGHSSEAGLAFRSLLALYLDVQWISAAPADRLLVWEAQDLRSRLLIADETAGSSATRS
jgi:hypothetical protein